MRIAYVSADWGVPVFGRKGCSIHAQAVLRALLETGATVDLLTTHSDGEVPPGLAALRLHTLPRPAKGDAAMREQAALAGNDLLRAELEMGAPFDLVYERYSLWSCAGMEFARAAGVPGLLEVNAPLIEEQAQYRVLIDRAEAGRVAERVFGAASALLAVSREVADYLESFPAARGKVHIVPNGVDPERFPEGVKPARPAADGTFTVGFVGTLKPWHGLGTLVEAFARLHADQPTSRLLVVGDGPERERIEAELAARGLSGAAELTGAVPAGEVPALLASMDVAVAPYPNLEPFYFSPIKVYEYMAAGLPVVASRIGQLKQLIDSGITGVLVPPGDAEALAAALKRLRENPALRRRLGRAGRVKVLRHHTWTAVAQQIFQVAQASGLRLKASRPRTIRPRGARSGSRDGGPTIVSESR